MRRNIYGHRLIPPTAALLLALAAGQASAVEVELLRLGETRNTVHVAILGAENFDPSTVTRKGLVLGWSKQGRDGGYVPAIRLSRARGDVNGDGFRDRIAVFRLSDPDFQVLRDGEIVQIELRGVYHDLFGRAFVAHAPAVGAGGPVLGDSDPFASCAKVTNQQGALVGERCIWPTADGSAFKPIVVGALIDDLNQALATTDLEITDSAAVVIEAYGGVGQPGGSASDGGTSCNAIGGNGGAPGYAQTVVTAGGLPPALYVYSGGPGVIDGEGGAGSVASSVDLADLSLAQLGSSTVQGLLDADILAIAGGGGGGGEGHVQNNGSDCHHGGDGGAGGTALATTVAAAVGGGADGTRGTPGSGGNGTGGSGKPAGTSGIGGPGGLGYPDATEQSTGGGPLWSGWTTADNANYASTAWVFGAGGSDDESAGAGGGGFGGGGSADGSGSAHRGGGGGGGSFAMQATVDSDSIAADLIYGAGATGSRVVVTFQLVQSAQ